MKTALENARNNKVLGSPLQCSVVLQVPKESEALPLLQEYAAELDSIFVVSSVKVVPVGEQAAEEATPEWEYTAPFEVQGGAPATAVVRPPLKEKCVRCWRYLAEKEDDLCGRCEDVVKKE